jgi:hypothetical protein
VLGHALVRKEERGKKRGAWGRRSALYRRCGEGWGTGHGWRHTAVRRGGGGHEEGAARHGMANSGPAVAFADGVRPAPK